MRETECVKCTEENKEKINLQIAKILNNIGCVYFEYGELRDAKDTYEEALDIQRDNLCTKDPDDPAYLAMASTLCNLGEKYDKNSSWNHIITFVSIFKTHFCFA